MVEVWSPLSRSHTPLPGAGATVTTGHCWAAMGMEDQVVPGRDQAASGFTTEQRGVNVQLSKNMKFKDVQLKSGLSLQRPSKVA